MYAVHFKCRHLKQVNYIIILVYSYSARPSFARQGPCGSGTGGALLCLVLNRGSLDMNSGCWNLRFRPCVSKAVELVQHSWHVPTGRLSQVREDKSLTH